MTAIQWTDETWNPIAAFDAATGKRGWFCTKPSAGCTNCYAETMNVFRGNGLRYKVGNAGMVRFELVNLDRPLKWKRPRRVFVCSMTDLFLEQHTAPMIVRVFATMAAAQRHTFQVLTKRPARMRELLNDERFRRVVEATVYPHGNAAIPWPLPNVWIGTTTENQQTADERIPELLATPAAVRWLSIEPLLGVEVDLGMFPPFLAFSGGAAIECEHGCDACPICDKGIDWVVVGGESGPKARVTHIHAIEDVIAQCGLAHVPVFVKQLGRYPVDELLTPVRLESATGGIMDEWPSRFRVRQFPQT